MRYTVELAINQSFCPYQKMIDMVNDRVIGLVASVENVVWEDRREWLVYITIYSSADIDYVRTAFTNIFHTTDWEKNNICIRKITGNTEDDVTYDPNNMFVFQNGCYRFQPVQQLIPEQSTEEEQIETNIKEEMKEVKPVIKVKPIAKQEELKRKLNIL